MCTSLVFCFNSGKDDQSVSLFSQAKWNKDHGMCLPHGPRVQMHVLEGFTRGSTKEPQEGTSGGIFTNTIPVQCPFFYLFIFFYCTCWITQGTVIRCGKTKHTSKNNINNKTPSVVMKTLSRSSWTFTSVHSAFAVWPWNCLFIWTFQQDCIRPSDEPSQKNWEKPTEQLAAIFYPGNNAWRNTAKGGETRLVPHKSPRFLLAKSNSIFYLRLMSQSSFRQGEHNQSSGSFEFWMYPNIWL